MNNNFPNGKSYKTVEKRIQSFLNDLKNKYENKTVAIVGHQIPQLALIVLLNGMNWNEALESDWRKSGIWQPGWEYTLE